MWVVGPFDCGRVPGWKIDGPKRIFVGWRQLCNAIAAPSTDALKRSSWYRKQVMRSAQFAALRWNRGWSPPTFPHTNLLNVHRQKMGRTNHRPKRPRDPTNSSDIEKGLPNVIEIFGAASRPVRVPDKQSSELTKDFF